MTEFKSKCPSCDASMMGRFCHHCGEKSFVSNDMKFKNVVSDISHSATDLDGKFLKSLRLLILNPGRLTVNYLSGRRVSFLTPFRLFLFINIIYFVAASLIGQTSFSTRLNTHVNASNFIHKEMAQQMVDDRVISTGQTFESFEKLFNSLVEIQAKVFVVLMIPMLAFCVWLMTFRKKHAAVSAWVFVTHSFSMTLLIFLLVSPLVNQIVLLGISMGVWHLNEWSFEWITTSLLFSSIGLYCFFAFQRVYKSPVLINVMRSMVFVFCFYYALLTYRMLLFFITFYTL